MSVDKAMLVDLLEEQPFQPATAFWRSVEIAEVVKRSLPSGRGLDLGCGDGKLTNILLNRIGRRELVGVDIDPLETSQAARFDFYTKIHTTRGESIPEPDASFDFAFSNSVLEHIPTVEPVLREVARLLRPGGRFLFTVPSADFHTCLRGSLLPFSSRERYLTELDRRCAHFYYLSEKGWSDLLEKCGMRMDYAISYLTRAEVRRWETLSRFTGGLLYSIFGNTKRPIEIQRSLGMRTGNARLPRWMAAAFARSVSGLLSAESELNGCLLIEAVR